MSNFADRIDPLAQFWHPWRMPFFALLLFPLYLFAAQSPTPADTLVGAKPALAQASSSIPPASVEPYAPGISRLRADGFSLLKGRRVGLLTHMAAVDENGVTSAEIFRAAPEVNLTALFSPEHGLDGLGAADEKIADGFYRGVPVYSLYGDVKKPTAEMLRKIDLMVIDLQDIGVRSYTYISAMKYVIAASFEAGLPVIVLDRPNPLGGRKVDGPVLEPAFKSYVGTYQVPYVYGLTIGELARLGADELKPLRGSLTVVKMTGWRRWMLWSDLRPQPKWRAPSPIIASVGAAFGYACTGLGSQLGGFRHGYATEYPFRLLELPGMPLEKLKARLDRAGLIGFDFLPTKTKTGKQKEGLYVRISNWSAASPTALSLTMLQIAQEERGKAPFADIKESTANLFCKHWGRAEPLHTLASGKPLNAMSLARYWQAQALQWQEKVARKYWLYD